MSVRFYQMTWLVFIFIATVFFLTGSLTPLVGVVFGFIIFGLIFMGMMSVLPTSIVHPAPDNNRLGMAITSKFHLGINRFHEWRNSWMSSSSIEVRKPKFH